MANKTYRLLVVDDDIPADTAILAGSDMFHGYMWYYLQDLRDAGYEVDVARDPDEALLRLERSPSFDLAIVDIMMPPGKAFRAENTARGVRTGLFLVQQIHKIHVELPIFILSNAVPSRPDAPQGTTYKDLVTNNVVKEILFKLDIAPIDLVRRVNRLFGKDSDHGE